MSSCRCRCLNPPHSENTSQKNNHFLVVDHLSPVNTIIYKHMYNTIASHAMFISKLLREISGYKLNHGHSSMNAHFSRLTDSRNRAWCHSIMLASHRLGDCSVGKLKIRSRNCGKLTAHRSLNVKQTCLTTRETTFRCLSVSSKCVQTKDLMLLRHAGG